MNQAESLPVAIQALHQAIAEHPEPQAKQILTTCLQNMLKVQQMDHAAAKPQTPQAGPYG